MVPVSILGAGNHIAGLLLDVESGKADGVNPLAGFVVSHDGGATFTQVSADAMGISRR